jgi:chloramphenicol-sensitive protein RarD
VDSALNARQRGLLLGVAAQLIWGFAPLYWIRTAPVSSVDLVAHRVLWSVPFLTLCLALVGQLPFAARIWRTPRTVLILAGCALCSALNWSIFLWAVTHGKAAQASLGYFLLPMVNVVIGLIVFRERMDVAQRVAVGFALAAIALLVWRGGGIPLAALGVACSFGCYAAIRKAVAVDAVHGLWVETLLLLPVAVGWLMVRDGGGLGNHGVLVDALLLGSGVLTALPLIAYVSASRLMPLSALGLVSYIGPTTQFLVALTVLREPLGQVQFIAFALVWAGLLLVSLDSLRRLAAARRVARQTPL